MLNNATEFQQVYIAAGYTDLHRGIDGLASIAKFNFQLDPYEKDILFLFCGRRSDRIKGLVWKGDGFLLLYKRLELDDLYTVNHDPVLMINRIPYFDENSLMISSIMALALSIPMPSIILNTRSRIFFSVFDNFSMVFRAL